MRLVYFFLVFILFSNIVNAQSDFNPVDFIKDLIIALIKEVQDFFIGILNSPIEPLLSLIKELLTMPINLSLFIGLWKIVVYILSFFYGLIFIYNGLNFIISSYDPIKRENAKSWLKNSILMIFFINASYIFYKFLIDLSSLLSFGALNLVDSKIFLIETNFTDIGFQLVYLILFLIISFVTLIFLGIRYLLVSFGLVLFPIGLLLYFIPYTKAFGKFIIELLLVAIFLPFIDALLLVGASKLLEIQFFSNFNIFALTIGLSLINLTMILLGIFVLMKSIMPQLRPNFGRIYYR